MAMDNSRLAILPNSPGSPVNNHNPIVFKGEDALGYIAFLGSNTVITAAALGTAPAESVGILPAWISNATPLPSGNPCGATISVCGGPFIRGTSPGKPLGSAAGRVAACVLGDLWLTQAPTSGLYVGYYCAVAGPGGMSGASGVAQWSSQ